MKNFLLPATLVLFANFKVFGSEGDLWISGDDFKQLSQETEQKSSEFIDLGKYPGFVKVEKIVSENAKFSNVPVCEKSFPMNVFAKKYEKENLSEGTWRKYNKFLRAQKRKLESIKNIVEALPKISSCETSLNGVQGKAFVSGVILFDLTQSTHIRGRIFPDFFMGSSRVSSVALGQTLSKAGNFKGLKLYQYAAPTLESENYLWNYFSVEGKNFQEVATATIEFKY